MSTVEELKRRVISDPEDESAFLQLLALLRREGYESLLKFLIEIKIINVHGHVSVGNHSVEFFTDANWALEDIVNYFRVYYGNPTIWNSQSEGLDLDLDFFKKPMEEAPSGRLEATTAMSFKSGDYGDQNSIVGVLIKRKSSLRSNIKYSFLMRFVREEYIEDPISQPKIKSILLHQRMIELARSGKLRLGGKIEKSKFDKKKSVKQRKRVKGRPPIKKSLKKTRAKRRKRRRGR